MSFQARIAVHPIGAERHITKRRCNELAVIKRSRLVFPGLYHGMFFITILVQRVTYRGQNETEAIFVIAILLAGATSRAAPILNSSSTKLASIFVLSLYLWSAVLKWKAKETPCVYAVPDLPRSSYDTSKFVTTMLFIFITLHQKKLRRARDCLLRPHSVNFTTLFA